MSGEAIEKASMAAIDREAPDHGHDPGAWEVVRRMVHATANFDFVRATQFSPDALAAGTEALRAGRPLYVDSNMIRSGLSLARLRTAWPDYGPGSIHCLVAAHEVAAEARTAGLPRSLFAVRRAKEILHGGIAVFGNAPVGLLELNRLMLQEGVRPALVIGLPVGFVHVVESKKELAQIDVPQIRATGRIGGSPVAVSVLHSLCNLATRKNAI
jgi:precorrin isomerase